MFHLSYLVAKRSERVHSGCHTRDSCSQIYVGHKRNEHERFCLYYVSIRWLLFCSLAQSLTAFAAQLFSLKITSGAANHVGLFKKAQQLCNMHCDACRLHCRETYTFRSERKVNSPKCHHQAFADFFFRINMLMAPVAGSRAFIATGGDQFCGPQMAFMCKSYVAYRNGYRIGNSS